MSEPVWHFDDLRSEYTIIKELGAGQFGTTFLVVHRASGLKFACKSINKHARAFNRRDVEREVQILAALRGKANVVELAEVWEDSHSIHIVQELCQGGELFDVIVARGHLSEKDAAVVAGTLLRVVKACHDLSILNRDLKPENWLLKYPLGMGDPLESEALRVIDFGLSVFLTPGQELKTLAGSSYYIAPEVVRGKYGLESDLWSAGVIIYILLCGLPPFWGSTEKQIFRRILHEPLDLESVPWPEVSSSAKDLISKLLNRDPRERLTVEKALAHPWVSQHSQAPDKPLSSAVFKRLARFRCTSALKLLLLDVVAQQLPSESISALRDMFKTMDKRNTGTVTVDELKEAIQKAGWQVDAQALQDMVERMDVDKDGAIEYEGFLKAALDKKALVTEQSLSFLFAQLDRDNDGLISLDDFCGVINECNAESGCCSSQLGRKQIEGLMKEAGVKPKAGITPELFKKLMYELARDEYMPGHLEKFLETAKRVTENNGFKQLALMVMASSIPADEVQELHDLFTAIDEEGTGFISFDQLRQALDVAGFEMAKEEVDALLEGLDVTGNGKISYTEFLAGCMESQKLVSDMKIKEAFGFFDRDGSGCITLDELREALTQLDMDPGDASRMMLLADADANGQISFEEFAALMVSSNAPSLINRMATMAGPGVGDGTGSFDLGRASMGAPLLSRASMGVGSLSRPSMGGFAGLSRPSMGAGTPLLSRPSMSPAPGGNGTPSSSDRGAAALAGGGGAAPAGMPFGGSLSRQSMGPFAAALGSGSSFSSAATPAGAPSTPSAAAGHPGLLGAQVPTPFAQPLSGCPEGGLASLSRASMLPPVLLSRDGSTGSVGTGASPLQSRLSMRPSQGSTGGGGTGASPLLSRLSMRATQGGDGNTLLRKSMVPPSLARASMQGMPMPEATPVQAKLAEVEAEWRKGFKDPQVQGSAPSASSKRVTFQSQPMAVVAE